MDFKGKRALVTGAGKGIGHATAKLLHARGAEVIALSRTAADLDALREEIGCETLCVDLEDLEAARRATIEALPVDLLVNNAAITVHRMLLDHDVETFERIMKVNVTAPMAITKEVASDLIARGKGGAIVNVSSMAAFVGLAMHTAYCASKGALDAMSRAWAVELGPKGIRVNVVNPTVTMTPMGIKAWADPERRNKRLERIPVGRFAQPEDIAEAIVWLLDDAAAMVHGLSMPVDGGFHVI